MSLAHGPRVDSGDYLTKGEYWEALGLRQIICMETCVDPDQRHEFPDPFDAVVLLRHCWLGRWVAVCADCLRGYDDELHEVWTREMSS